MDRNDLIPMPEDEDVKEVITPKQVASNFEQETQNKLKKINTIKEVEEEEEQSNIHSTHTSAHMSGHQSLGLPHANPYQ